MPSPLLTTTCRKVVGFFFNLAIALLGYLAILPVVWLAMLVGWTGEPERVHQVLTAASFLFAIPFLVCTAAMMSYAIWFLWHLWREGSRGSALVASFDFLYAGMFVGYFWYYWTEIKHQEIQCLLFWHNPLKPWFVKVLGKISNWKS